MQGLNMKRPVFPSVLKQSVNFKDEDEDDEKTDGESKRKLARSPFVGGSETELLNSVDNQDFLDVMKPPTKVVISPNSNKMQTTLQEKTLIKEISVSKDIPAKNEYEKIPLCEKHEKEQTPATFVKSLAFDIDLTKLYKLVHSECYDDQSAFCPVVLQVGEDMQKKDLTFSHLLQVWSQKGQLVFERKLANQLVSCNMIGNDLIWQEREDNKCCEVWLLRLPKPKEEPSKAPKNSQPKSTAKKEKTEPTKLQLFKLHLEHKELQNPTEKSAITFNKYRSVAFLPDKQILLLHHNNKVFFADLTETLSQKSCSNEVIEVKVKEEIQFLFSNQINTPQQHVQEKDSNVKDNHILGFYGVRHNSVATAAMLVEREWDKGIEFLVVAQVKGQTFSFDLIGKQEDDNEGSLERLADDDVKKVRHLSHLDKKGEFHNFTLVLRKNGSLDFFYGFQLVKRHSGHTKEVQDIDCDFNYLYFLMSKPEAKKENGKGKNCIKKCQRSKKVENTPELDSTKDFVLHKVSIVWHGRVSISTSKETKDGNKWTSILHRRVMKHFNLFPTYLNFMNYYLVAHRNYMSVFDLQDIKWIYHHTFEDQVQSIALHQMNKDIGSKTPVKTAVVGKVLMLQRAQSAILPFSNDLDFDSLLTRMGTLQLNKSDEVEYDDQYKVVVISGCNSIDFFQKEEEQFVHCKEYSRRKKINGGSEHNAECRVLKMQIDSQQVTGLYMLIQMGGTEARTMQSCPGARNSFRQTKDTSGELRLIVLRNGKQFILLSDDSDVSNVCNHENVLRSKSDFSVFQGKPERELAQGDESGVCSETFKELLVVSPTNRKHVIFSLDFLDHNKDEPKILAKKCLTLDESKDMGRPVSFIMANDQEYYGAYFKWICKVSTRGFSVFNREGKFQFAFSGFTIATTFLADNTYLYCLVNNPNTKPITNFGPNNKTERLSQEMNTMGLQVFDVARLFQDKKKAAIETYKLMTTVIYNGSKIDHSEFSDRISIISNFDEIRMIPFPHRNTISFLGMGSKRDYILWREQNGYFSALNKETREILTWRVSTGKMVCSKKLPRWTASPAATTIAKARQSYPSPTPDGIVTSEGREETEERDPLKAINIQNYVIYETNPSDLTYKSNFYNYDDKSITLLREKEIDIEEMSRTTLSEKSLVRKNSVLSGVKVKINDYMSQRLRYHFKVLQMTEKNEKKEEHNRTFEVETVEVSEVMNFFFNVEDVFDKSLEKHNDSCKRIDQRLFLSKDLTKLLEVRSKRTAFLYKRQTAKTPELKPEQDHVQHSPHIEWIQLAKIKQFPQALQGNVSANFLFSPNFTYFIDSNIVEGNFVIKKTVTENAYCVIPSQLLSLKKEDTAKAIDYVSFLAKRMMFVDENKLRIINKEGLDVIFEIQPKGEFAELQILSFEKIDNFNGNYNKDLLKYHAILEPKPFENSDTLNRLIQRTQEYKCWFQHAKHYLAGNEHMKKEFLINKMYQVDYSEDWKEPTASFMAQISFTLLDWMINQKMVQNDRFNLNEIDKGQQLQLCFNIFPGAKTTLHSIADTDKIQLIAELFRNAANGAGEKDKSYELCLLRNLEGLTALDLTMNVSKVHDITGRHKRHFSSQEINNKEMAKVFFEHLKNYKYLNFSSTISEAICKAIKIDVPDIGTFLDSRFIETKIDIGENQKQVKSKHMYKIKNKVLGILPEEAWTDGKQLKNDLFSTSGSDAKITSCYFDIPNLHNDSIESQTFVRQLAKSENVNLFQHESVQLLVSYHWRKKFWLIFGIQFVPFLVLLGIFFYWSNFKIKMHDDKHNLVEQEVAPPPTPVDCTVPDPEATTTVAGGVRLLQWSYNTKDDVVEYLLIGLALYFLFIQFAQFISSPGHYFNKSRIHLVLMETLLVALVMCNCFRSMFNQPKDVHFWNVQAIAAMLMWIKLINFLRMFSATGYLIRMIYEVIKDMLAFALVLTISIIALSDAYGSIGAYQFQNDEYFVTFSDSLKYMYFQTLGDFREPNDGDMEGWKIYIWTLFVLSSILNLIVMLNLLIAIISDTYARVASKKTEYEYMEKIGLVHNFNLLYYFIGKLCCCNRMACCNRQRERDPLKLLMVVNDSHSQSFVETSVEEKAMTQLDEVTALCQTIISMLEKKAEVDDSDLPPAMNHISPKGSLRGSLDIDLDEDAQSNELQRDDSSEFLFVPVKKRSRVPESFR